MNVVPTISLFLSQAIFLMTCDMGNVMCGTGITNLSQEDSIVVLEYDVVTLSWHVIASRGQNLSAVVRNAHAQFV